MAGQSRFGHRGHGQRFQGKLPVQFRPTLAILVNSDGAFCPSFTFTQYRLLGGFFLPAI